MSDEYVNWDQFVGLFISLRAKSRSDESAWLKTLPADVAAQITQHSAEERQWEMDVLKSPAFRKAFAAMTEAPVDEVVEQAAELLLCLSDIRRAVPYSKTPGSLLDPIELMREERRRAIAHLQEAASIFSPIGRNTYGDPCGKYWAEIMSLAGRIAAELYPQTTAQMLGGRFNPKNLARKGKAATDGEGAFKGWMVRELARRVPKSAPKRATAIAELLSLVDVHVSAQNVNMVVSRTR